MREQNGQKYIKLYMHTERTIKSGLNVSINTSYWAADESPTKILSLKPPTYRKEMSFGFDEREEFLEEWVQTKLEAWFVN